MAFALQKTSRPASAQPLRQSDQRLAAKARRRWAAREAITLGHGGTRSSATGLGGDPHTVHDGMRALTPLPDAPAGRRVRTPGGGRKKTDGNHADVPHQGQDTLKHRTAGDPLRPPVVWTALPPPRAGPKSAGTHRLCRTPHRT